MPTVSSIDGFRCYRNHHTTGHLRLSVSSRKRRQTLKRINVAGERRQWTSVKAIYVNAETRILIYILCGTEICDYNPRRRRCIGQRASRPPPFPLLFPRDEIYIYIYNASSSFAIRGARDGDEKVTKPCVSRKTLDLPGIRHSRID